jgi:hypothetical protein
MGKRLRYKNWKDMNEIAECVEEITGQKPIKMFRRNKIPIKYKASKTYDLIVTLACITCGKSFDIYFRRLYGMKYSKKTSARNECYTCTADFIVEVK